MRVTVLCVVVAAVVMVAASLGAAAPKPLNPLATETIDGRSEFTRVVIFLCLS